MSMTSITLICRPTKDPELRTSPSGVIFTTLDVAVTKGFGDKEHPNYFRAYSLIYITGDLDIRPFTRKDGSTGTANEITVFDWGYVNTGKPKSEDGTQTQNGAPAAQNNLTQTPPAQAPQYNPYANVPQPQFEEIGDDDELPF